MVGIVCVVLFALQAVFANVTVINNSTTYTTSKLTEVERRDLKDSITDKSADLMPTDSETEALERRVPQNKRRRGSESAQDFWKRRNAIADEEVQSLTGSNLTLNAKEIEANDIVCEVKFEEYDEFYGNLITSSSRTFYGLKSIVERTDIFAIINHVPKGVGFFGLLGAVPFQYMFYNLTYEDDLYYRLDNKKLRLRFSRSSPGSHWELLSEARDSASDLDEFNYQLKAHLSFTESDQENLNDQFLTNKLVSIINLYGSLVYYVPNFERAFLTALETIYDNNIMFAIIALDFTQIYDLNGKVYNPVEVLLLCEEIIEEFMESHKDFFGIRLIYLPRPAPLTSKNLTEIRETLLKLRDANPKIVLGFGLRRLNEPLSDWAEELLKFPKELRLYVNAGLTKNWGVASDFSLLDALALDFATIGSAFALNKHPVVLRQMKRSNIPVVFSPLSTQVLGFIRDQRVNPLTLLMAEDHPFILSNFGGSAWNNTGLSHDWYAAYMSMTPLFCDIRCLKQFALNSIYYCPIPETDKRNLIRKWNARWNKFIDYVIANY